MTDETPVTPVDASADVPAVAKITNLQLMRDDFNSAATKARLENVVKSGIANGGPVAFEIKTYGQPLEFIKKEIQPLFDSVSAKYEGVSGFEVTQPKSLFGKPKGDPFVRITFAR